MLATHLGFYNTATSRTHVRFQFSTHAAAGGNVAPNSAFENSDLRIYRAADGAAFSATQRSSASGITMTSPFDSLTGFHDVDIDLTDNTDAGFYASGYLYAVVLAPDETVDSQTLTGVVLAYFEIVVPAVNVTQFGGTAGTFSGGRPEVNTTHAAGTAWGSGAITAAALAADCITAAKLAADVTTELQNGLATQASVNTIDDFLDTEVAAILAAVDTEIAAIKAVTDQMVFTIANRLDVQLQGAAAGTLTASALATDAANEIADALLDRDMSTGTDSGSTTVRTVRQALRALRNRVAIAAGTVTVYKENDTTASWTGAVTTAAGDPISEVNPAGP